MASYRPYAPPPQHPPPPPPPPQGGYPPQMNSYAPPPQQAPYSRMPAPTYHAGPPPPPPPGPPPPHQPQFNFGPGPPQQLPPPPPPQMYYQPPPPPYGGNSNPPPPPSAPPPPPSPPPAASPPPPPPPAQPPSAHALLPPKGPQPKATLLRAETEEERRARKKREFEKQRVDDRKQHQMMRQTQATILQKTQQVRTAQQQPQSRHHHHHPPGGSRAGATGSRPATAVNAERFENRLKKPTTFLCKHKFRNELPDPSAQLKWLPLNKDKDRNPLFCFLLASNLCLAFAVFLVILFIVLWIDVKTEARFHWANMGKASDYRRYTKYRITSLEKNYIPKMIVPEDIGIPLDLLDMSVYNPPDVQPPMAPEDEELLRDDQVLTPIKQEGTRKRERPTDKGVSWLVKTQYISPLSADAAKTSLTEKQAKERRESRGGRNAFLDNLNDREKQIKAIEESFRAAKSRPVHQTKRGMQAEWVMPLLPDFDRYEEPFVMVNFDGDPTADSEQYNKLERPVRDECESRISVTRTCMSFFFAALTCITRHEPAMHHVCLDPSMSYLSARAQAVMKSFSVSGSDPSKQEKFLAYMAPAPHELTRDLDDENDDIQYSWLREYHWEVRGDDKDDPTTYLVTFDKKDGAKYLANSKPRRSHVDDDLDEHPKRTRVEDIDQYSEEYSE
ncbi:Protein PAF1-like protein [Zea mays]|uniref:Protein PAF1-like protein n=1 Tax=Zea mays TaxID=4577 RepID=A0A1D6PVZ9_MAIZE|nr:Protein PAF1-like protein [Zea mays]